MRRRHAAMGLLVMAALMLASPVDSQTRPAGRGALTSQPGDVARGRLIVRDLNKASCLICHAMPISEEPDHGTIGPPLAGVGTRYSAAELRARVTDASAENPATVMPPYFRSQGLTGVLDKFRGTTIYTAQEVEDVVAYLLTLKTP